MVCCSPHHDIALVVFVSAIPNFVLWKLSDYDLPSKAILLCVAEVFLLLEFAVGPNC